MSDRFETLRVEADGAVGMLTLARPERLNALSRRTLIELAGAARWFDMQRDVKVVVVRGEGRSFSAGFDLDDFSTPDPQWSTRDTAHTVALDCGDGHGGHAGDGLGHETTEIGGVPGAPLRIGGGEVVQVEPRAERSS
ncbi:MAG: enoyl-CoA hydratase/isomerase family protein, partial [Acidimicrobiales bacterium]